MFFKNANGALKQVGLGIAVLASLTLTGPVAASETAKDALMQTARIAAPKPDAIETPAPAMGAQAVVQKLYEQLLQTMQQGEALGFQGRYDALKPVVEQVFDLPVMTRFASGTGWLKADAVQQQKLINAFSDFSISTYASRFEAFDGEEFKIVSEKPAAGGGVIVATQLVPKDGAPVTLNYLLRQDKQNQWRVNDVFLEATISEMAVRRSEFSAVIRDQGVEGLIGNITAKASAMRSL
jgi:phospholipid transport system substrate-binding protein